MPKAAAGGSSKALRFCKSELERLNFSLFIFTILHNSNRVVIFWNCQVDLVSIQKAAFQTRVFAQAGWSIFGTACFSHFLAKSGCNCIIHPRLVLLPSNYSSISATTQLIPEEFSILYDVDHLFLNLPQAKIISCSANEPLLLCLDGFPTQKRLFSLCRKKLRGRRRFGSLKINLRFLQILFWTTLKPGHSKFSFWLVYYYHSFVFAMFVVSTKFGPGGQGKVRVFSTINPSNAFFWIDLWRCPQKTSKHIWRPCIFNSRTTPRFDPVEKPEKAQRNA